MRESRESEVLWVVSVSRKGLRWRDLIIHFPRKTLDRHLKALIEKGFVEKVPEPREKGQRGRQSTRYRVPAKYWRSWGCLVVHYPVRRLGSRWFFGRKIKRAYSGKEFVRLYPTEKEKFEKYKAELKRTSNSGKGY